PPRIGLCEAFKEPSASCGEGRPLGAPAFRNVRGPISPRRRSVGMRLRSLAPFAVLAIALGIATSGGSALHSRLASFRPASGWLVQRAGADNPSLVAAVTVQDAGAVHPVTLFSSFKKLSRNGILVWVASLGRGRTGFPT